MADMLCENCGMPNAEEQTQCSFCGEPLQKSVGPASIQPGQAPTKKTTAELEPILPQWLRDARQQAREGAQEEKAKEARLAIENPAPPAQDSPSDFLAGLAATTRHEDSEEIPDWMRGVPGLNVPAPRVEKTEEPTISRRQEIRWEEEPAEEEGASQTQADNSASVPSWMQADKNAVPQKSDSLDWLTRSEDVPPAAVAQNPLEATPSASENLSWMEALAPAPPEAGSPALAVDPADDLPDWMKSAPAAQTPPVNTDAGLPDWMRQVEQPAAAQPAPADDVPDWLSRMNPPSMGESPAPLPKTAAFISDDSSDGANVDDLFAIEMPDWLSSIAPTDKSIPAPPPAPNADELKPAAEEISPASLPSWVQAMRPVENVTPGIFPSSSDQPRESEGPLAGLVGVLPAAPRFAPSGRPKALSIRLQPSEAQQTGATLLDQMLEAETHPRPMRTASLAVSQRSLRWLVAAVLLFSVSLPLFLNLQIVPLPALSNQNQAVADVLQSFPEGAPALVVFDYEPALAGEMEASALGLLDSFINLRHPHLTFLSTSPTGGALAEHLIASLHSTALTRGEQFTNLGYLPGGTAGILSFAENPPSSMRYNAAWNSAATQGINTFADYAVVILITDQSETARAWVEQTGALRAGRPMIIVSSAQAAPMIRPYIDSGQVNGLVAGLRDGAAFESLSTDYRGPAGFYWTAYNLSLLGALSMIVLGAVWNLFNRQRARRSGLDEI